MAKSSWKFYYVGRYFLKKTFLKKFKKIKFKMIFCRSTVVSSIFKNRFVYLYKGNEILKTYFNKYSTGYKLGEFSLSRRPFSFPQKKKTKNKGKR